MELKRNEMGDIYDSLERFEFINGKKGVIGPVERGEFVGYTIILKTLHKNTYVHLISYEEAWDTIDNHCENYNKLTDQDRLRGQYMNDNKWARQDSFDNSINFNN